nr:PD-(D/E)XK nuclease family transposase [Fibrobacter sp.]
MDLHCTDDSGNFIEIEVQIRPFTNFLKRLAFYAGQMVVSQGYPGWKYEVKPTEKAPACSPKPKVQALDFCFPNI